LVLGAPPLLPPHFAAPEPLTSLPDGEASQWWGWTTRGSHLSRELGDAAQ
jgi:hypothetical protein